MNEPIHHPHECICPVVREPCIGKRCCQFVPRHNYLGTYSVGIQDIAIMIWYRIRGKEYVEPTYTEVVSAHCTFGIKSAIRWDKEEFKEGGP
jgi:hypothetical protein